MLRPNQNLFLSLITSGFHQCQSLINSRHLNRPSGNAGDGRLGVLHGGDREPGPGVLGPALPWPGAGASSGAGGLPLVK